MDRPRTTAVFVAVRCQQRCEAEETKKRKRIGFSRFEESEESKNETIRSLSVLGFFSIAAGCEDAGKALQRSAYRFAVVCAVLVGWCWVWWFGACIGQSSCCLARLFDFWLWQSRADSFIGTEGETETRRCCYFCFAEHKKRKTKCRRRALGPRILAPARGLLLLLL